MTGPMLTQLKQVKNMHRENTCMDRLFRNELGPSSSTPNRFSGIRHVDGQAVQNAGHDWSKRELAWSSG